MHLLVIAKIKVPTYCAVMVFLVPGKLSSGTVSICALSNVHCSLTLLYSSVVIDHLRSQSSGQDRTAIACLYSDYRDQSNQTVLNILGSLLKQLLTDAPQLPMEVSNMLKGEQPDINHVVHMAKITLQLYSRTYICIDAVDELEDRTRLALFRAMQDLLNMSGIRLFITGRPHIEKQVSTEFNAMQQLAITITANPDDVRLFLRHELEKEDPETLNEQLKEQILTTLIEKSEDM